MGVGVVPLEHQVPFFLLTQTIVDGVGGFERQHIWYVDQSSTFEGWAPHVG
ncbi:MAG: hypothetical protein ACI9GW_003070 [Halieaceae bacterium]